MAPFNPLPRPALLVPSPLSGVTDKRARFRAVLCAVVRARDGQYPDQRPCDEILWDLGDEGASAELIPAELRHVRARILMVPGFLGECLSRYVTPFSSGSTDSDGHPVARPYAYLERLGYNVEVAATHGRSASSQNVQIIRDALVGLEASAVPVIVIAYSKGLPDTLEAIRTMKEQGVAVPKSLRALVSVAGVVSGTPVADRLDKLYRELLEGVPMRDCHADGTDPVESLTREERIRRLPAELGAIPDWVRLYSVVAMAPATRINRELLPFYKLLSAADPHNDGQIIYYDAVLPESTLLGYVQADHWAVALGFDRSVTPAWRRFINHNEFPREILLESILYLVESSPGFSLPAD